MPRTTTPIVNWIAISLGGAAGFLSAATFALVTWLVLELFGAAEPVTAAIVVGVLLGLFCSGYVAGRMSQRAVFNGALTAVLSGAAITLLALGEGSPAPAPVMTGFIAGSAVLGGIGALVADRRKQSH